MRSSSLLSCALLREANRPASWLRDLESGPQNAFWRPAKMSYDMCSKFLHFVRFITACSAVGLEACWKSIWQGIGLYAYSKSSFHFWKGQSYWRPHQPKLGGACSICITKERPSTSDKKKSSRIQSRGACNQYATPAVNADQ